MMRVEEHPVPTAFARAVNVGDTFAYMGSLMTFLAKGSETGGRFALMEYLSLGMSLRRMFMRGNTSCTLSWRAQCVFCPPSIPFAQTMGCMAARTLSMSPLLKSA
jgi:hypothetical protein